MAFILAGGVGPVDAIYGNSASDNSIRMAERQRISRELHNSTSQLVVALQLQVGQLRNCPALGTTEQLLDEMAEILQSIHESIKQIGMERDDGEHATLEARQVQIARLFFSLSQANRACG